MKRRTWRSMSWKVERHRRVEHYKRVHVKAKCKKSVKYVSPNKRKGKRKRGARSVYGCRRVRRVLRARPIYWTEYRATAQLGPLRFYVDRVHHDKSYEASVSLDGQIDSLAQASGATPAKAFNAALDAAEKQLKHLKTDTAKAIKLLYAP